MKPNETITLTVKDVPIDRSGMIPFDVRDLYMQALNSSKPVKRGPVTASRKFGKIGLVRCFVVSFDFGGCRFDLPAMISVAEKIGLLQDPQPLSSSSS